jgi:uncharacterized protein (DUF1800 family)
MRHPGMLYYLDNELSDGPDSLLGIKRHVGFKENLTRGSLELHTLGVDGGYTQAGRCCTDQGLVARVRVG